jgi:hypothetical protein
MKKKYIATFPPFYGVDAIKWDGKDSTLQQIIRMIGQHVSARHWKWDEYCEIVKRDGLKIFTRSGSEKLDIGNIVAIDDLNGDLFQKTETAFNLIFKPQAN